MELVKQVCIIWPPIDGVSAPIRLCKVLLEITSVAKILEVVKFSTTLKHNELFVFSNPRDVSQDISFLDYLYCLIMCANFLNFN